MSENYDAAGYQPFDGPHPLAPQHPSAQPPAPRVPPRADYYAPAPVPTPAPAPAEAEPEAKPSTVDALAEDAAPPQMPADAPPLWPYLKLPFRRRAVFFRKYADLKAAQGLLREMRDLAERHKAGEDVGDPGTDKAAQVYELYAVMDELLEICAVEPERYRRWVDAHTDEEFAGLFSAFMARTQPGEASSSAS